MKLTHVCKFWRNALINQPQAWATVFATQSDRRGFVQMCLQRSYPVSLEVTVDAYDCGPACTCSKEKRPRPIHDVKETCERHFAFESLAHAKHWERIHTLNIQFDDGYLLGRSPTDPPFSYSPFPPTLHSLSLRGFWHNQLIELNTLTSFTLNHHYQKIRTESFRAFILNNQSLETLSLGWIEFESDSEHPPVTLSSLRSFDVCFPSKALSTIVRVPAFHRLSSLLISTTEDYRNGWFSFRATGHEIILTVKCGLHDIGEAWRDLTGYAGPTIQHIRLENSKDRRLGNGKGDRVTTLFMDAHTLEIGRGYVPDFYSGFWDDLKKLGPQFVTIRFEIPERTVPFRWSGKESEFRGGKLLCSIEDLVTYRFKQGRPFSAVERMVVSESEQVNRQQDLVWRYFFNDCCLDKYIRHE